MAFTVKQIKAVLSSHGIPVENLDAAAEEICSRHKADMDSLIEERDSFKKSAADAEAYKEQLDEANSKLKAETDNRKAAEKERDEIKGKYDTAAADLDKIKAENAERETDEKCRKALADFLHEQKYSDFAVKNITRNGFHKSVQFGEDGKPKNLDEILKTIQADEGFSGFTPKTTEKSHTPATPPANTGGVPKATWEDVDKIKDDGERQAFMAQHKDDLGI